MVRECCVAEPGFYSMNLLMIGKTYMRMKDNDQAVEYLTKTRNCPVRTEDDKKVYLLLVPLVFLLQHYIHYVSYTAQHNHW